jgi:hypothetical protein
MPACFEDDPVPVRQSPVKRNVLRKRPPLPAPKKKEEKEEVVETRQEMFARFIGALDKADYLPIGKMKVRAVEQAALVQIREGNLAVKSDQNVSIEEILK